MDTIINTKTVSLHNSFGPIMAVNNAQKSAPERTTEGSGRSQKIPLNLSGHVWTEVQSRALVSLVQAVDESSVFVALVGPSGSGTSDLLDNLLVQAGKKDRICIAIRHPSKILAKDVAEIHKAVVKATAGIHWPFNMLIGVYDTHFATAELFEMINHFAKTRDRLLTTQVILAGEPELWEHLAAPYYEMLRRRFALRIVLPAILGSVQRNCC